MDTRKLHADLTESAYWDRNTMDPRREDLTELRNEDGETVAYSSHEGNTAELVRRWNEYPSTLRRADKAEQSAASLAFRVVQAEHALREAVKGLELAMMRDPDQAGTYNAAKTHADIFLQDIKA